MEYLDEIIARHAGHPAALLVALQEIQAHAGYIPKETLAPLAKSLGVPEGEILGVISFYAELRTSAPGKHRVRICNGDSCAALGSQRIIEAVQVRLHTNGCDTTHDGHFTCDQVYCLGNCALSPAVAIDGEVYGRTTPEGIVKRLEELEEVAHA